MDDAQPLKSRTPNIGNCSVDGCDQPMRKRTWCASHYAQWYRSGQEPQPFKYKWGDRSIPCANCGGIEYKPRQRTFCSVDCRAAFKVHGGPRPTSTKCVACGVQIDLTVRGKRGQLRKTRTKFCRPCKRDYAKYKMSAHELAARDGDACGICGESVDMSLSRSDGLMCPSVDHITPRSKGGTHDPKNLQLAHLVCNMRKSDRI